MSNLEQIIARQEEEWDSKVYSIPYAGQKYKKDIKEILEGVKQDIEKVDVSGGGSGRRLKEQFINHLEEVIKKL